MLLDIKKVKKPWRAMYGASLLREGVILLVKLIYTSYGAEDGAAMLCLILSPIVE